MSGIHKLEYVKPFNLIGAIKDNACGGGGTDVSCVFRTVRG